MSLTSLGESQKLEYHFLPFDPGNSDHISDSRELMRTVWGENDFSVEDYLHWQYQRNPFGPAFGFLAYTRDPLPGRVLPELAAQYILVPSRLWAPQTQVSLPVTLSVNTATHPNHQGKKLFVKCAQKTFEMARQKNYKAVYGFPNQNSLPGFVKTGFSQVQPLQMFAGVLSYASLIPRTISVLRHWGDPNLNQSIPSFEQDTGSLVKNLPEEHQLLRHFIHCPRDPAWVNWRYPNHPTRKYYFAGNRSALFVLRPMTYAGLSIYLLMDVIGNPDDEAVEKLRVFLMTNGAHIVCGVFSANVFQFYPRLAKLLKIKVPLRFSPKPFYTIFLNLIGEKPPAQPHFYSLGDIDLY